jgi:predicted PurR-regulated permease PerM
MNRTAVGVVFSTIFFLLLLLFIYSIAQIVLLLFLAALFSLYLGAITDGLQRRLGVPRRAGLTLALLITAAGVGGIGYLMVPPVTEQATELFYQLPRQLERWEAQLVDLAEDRPMVGNIIGQLEEGETYVGTVLAEIGSFFRGIVPYLFTGVRFLIHFASVLVMGVYLTLRPGLYREGLISLAPPVHRELVRDILTDLATTLRAWIVGQLFTMVALGILTWIGLAILGVPYAMTFGVFTAAVAIVPFFGAIASTLLPMLFVLSQGLFIKALLVLLVGVVVQLIESNIISPMVMERKVRLPPVLTLFSVLVMAHLMELIGLLVAVPVLATVMVIVRRIYVHRMLEGRGFRRAVRDQPVQIRLRDDIPVLIHPLGRQTSIPTLLERQDGAIS